MAQKTKVYYEFRSFDRDTTLILDKPAQITFQVAGLGTDEIIINNTYILRSRGDALNGTFKYPWELTLNNNVNEIDITNYVIRFTAPGYVLQVIIKYYENPSI